MQKRRGVKNVSDRIRKTKTQMITRPINIVIYIFGTMDTPLMIGTKVDTKVLLKPSHNERDVQTKPSFCQYTSSRRTQPSR
jgi:hypothetical protein